MTATPEDHQRESDARKTTSPAPLQTEPGRAHPLGATVDEQGVNFSVFSRHATAAELLLCEPHDEDHPIQAISFAPPANQTVFCWHVYVKGIKPGGDYA